MTAKFARFNIFHALVVAILFSLSISFSLQNEYIRPQRDYVREKRKKTNEEKSEKKN